MSDHISADRNLLFGILALQMDFISRDGLISAMNAWVLQKIKPLGDLLVERGELARSRRDLLEGLVDEHVRAHAGDATRSLQAISSAGDVADNLQHIADEHIQASLGHVRRIASLTPVDLGIETKVPHTLTPRTSWTGRFRIVRPHAKGGLGIVSVAMDDELDREVAFKEIKHEFADHPTNRARFVLEAEITGKLEHPGIVPIYGLGHAPDGSPYYAMRFIRGDSLADAVNRFHDPAGPYVDPRKHSLQLRELLGRFLDVCDAVAYAHSRGVLHRDLKPGNIMLGPFGETLVVDWGVALPLERVPEGHDSIHGAIKPTKTESGSLPSEKGSIVGTLAYMPPEQAEGNLDKLGPRSDVYGLGAILYDLLTGKFPSRGETEEIILKSIREGKITPPRQIRPDIPAALEAVCLKALALDPQHRYASPRDLASDIKAWMADEPVSARREPFSERARRWAKRNKTAVSGLAGAVLVGLIGFGAVAAVQTRARNDLDAKNRELDWKNSELVKSNTNLNLQRKRAEDREDQAIDAVKRFRDAVVNEPELKKSPTLESLRSRLLKEPLAFFRALREQLQADHDTRPDSLEHLSSACFDLGTLTNEIGDKQDAILAFRDSMAIRQKLADANPALMVHQKNVALCLNNIGYLLSATGQNGEALETLTKSLAIREKLAEANPTVAERQQDLAMTLDNLGILLKATGQYIGARQSFTKSLEIRRKLADDNPTSADYQCDLAKGLNHMGIVTSGIESLEYYKKAVVILEQVTEANPTVSDYQRVLALADFNVGNVLGDTGRPAEAMESHQKALAIRQKLADADPTATKTQSDLASSHTNVARLYDLTGQRDSAIKSCEKSLVIWQKLAEANPSVTEYHRAVALCLNNLGKLLSDTGENKTALEYHRKSMAIRQKLADANPTVTECQSDLAASLNAVGYLLHLTGQPVEALKNWRAALAIRQKLADVNPTATEFLNDMAASYNNIGFLLSQTGQSIEALETHKKALAIRQKLVAENPTFTQYQDDLACSFNNIAMILSDAGQIGEALESHKKALKIRQILAAANPTVAKYQSDLATSHNNIAFLIDATGQRAEAMESFRKALAISQKLVDAHPNITDYQMILATFQTNYGNLLTGTGQNIEAMDSYKKALALRQTIAGANPTVTGYQSAVAATLNNIGSLLTNTGEYAEALEFHMKALDIRQKLAEDCPTLPEFRKDLAVSYNNIGMLQCATGKKVEGLESHNKALTIRQKLSDSNPSVMTYQFDVTSSQNNVAAVELDGKHFSEALDRLHGALAWQKQALSNAPLDPGYRSLMRIILTNLERAGRELKDPAILAEVEREREAFEKSDPMLAALDHKLAAISLGEAKAKNNEELLQLAQRSYDKSLHTLAVTLWADAIAAEPKLRLDRQLQVPYNAACAAALAAVGKAKDVPPPDDAAKARLRGQALEWLQGELATWTGLVEANSKTNGPIVVQTLEHWKQDGDLDGIRDEKTIDLLPEPERAAWRKLWADFDALLARARTGK